MKRILPLLLTLLFPAAALAAPTSLDLWPIGHPFGAGYELGIDKSPTAGGCVQRELHDGQWLGGPCRDGLVLAKQSATDGSLHSVAHLGAALLYNAEGGNRSFCLRAGISVGPAAGAALAELASKLPALDSLVNWKAPPFLSYLGEITTLDFGVGYRPVHDGSVHGDLTYGPMVKLDIPLNDVYALLKNGL